MHPAPFFNALWINSFPLFFFPFKAKNKLFFLIVLESIERPSKFNGLIFPKIFLRINLFCK